MYSTRYNIIYFLYDISRFMLYDCNEACGMIPKQLDNQRHDTISMKW